MSAKSHGFEVGMSVFTQSRVHRDSRLVEWKITKIGRAWIYIEGFGKSRFDPSTMREDENNCGGMVYISRDEYIRSKEVNVAWMNFCRGLLSHLPPKGMTIDGIAEMQAIIDRGQP